MNEQAINNVIRDYAVENANLRISEATLIQELKATKEKLAETEELLHDLLKGEEVSESDGTGNL